MSEDRKRMALGEVVLGMVDQATDFNIPEGATPVISTTFMFDKKVRLKITLEVVHD